MALRDPQGRQIDYLRLSVTDRCNLRCTYCSPSKAGGHRGELDRAQLRRLVRNFAKLGIRRVRLTGGEPLWRHDIVELAEDVASTDGIDEVCLSTNGTNLAPLARSLRSAGVHKVNVSIDSLDPERFREISHGGELGQVLAGLDAALAAGFDEVAVNAVIVRGVNECDAGDLVRYCWERGVTPRFIELMPFAGGSPVSVLELQRALSLQGIHLSRELGRTPGQGPANYFQGEGGRVGFIGSLSQNFCSTCNRLRVTSRGELQACLGGDERAPLGPLLVDEVDDRAIEQAIRAALGRKQEGHRFLEPKVTGNLLSMMGIGG